MNRPLRVTVVAPYGVIGGAELWILSLLDVTDRLDADAVLLADGPLRKQFERRGVPCALRPTGRSVPELAGAAVWLARRLRAGRPDVVLANGVKAATVAAPAARLCAVPCVWAKHDHSFDGPLTRALAAVTDGCIGTEPGLVAASLHPRAALVPVPAPSGQPLPRQAARAELSRRGARLDGDERLLLTISRLVSYKGVDDAVQALARPGGLGWRLAVIGPDDPSDPGERARLTALAERLGVADRVDFAGWVQDAWRLLPAADCVAVLTKPDGTGPGQEAFGGTAIEAMLNGVPVITTGPGSVADRVAGPAEAPPGGITVPPADPGRVADALGRLSDPATRTALGRAGRRRTADNPRPAECAGLLAQRLAEAAHLPGAGLRGSAPVSVVVTLLDQGMEVDRFLTLTLPQLTVGGDEIVLVDRGSTDDTLHRVAVRTSRDPRIRLLYRPGARPAAARDAGVGAAARESIACADADCVPAPDWLDRLRAAAAEPDPAAVLFGVCRVTGRGPVAEAMAAAYPLPEECRGVPGPWRRVHRLLFGPGPAAFGGQALAFTRRAWQDTGGFAGPPGTGTGLRFARAAERAGHRCAVVGSAEVRRELRTPLRHGAVTAFQEGLELGHLADRRQLAGTAVRAVGYALAVAASVRGRRAGTAAAANALGPGTAAPRLSASTDTDPPLSLWTGVVARTWALVPRRRDTGTGGPSRRAQAVAGRLAAVLRQRTDTTTGATPRVLRSAVPGVAQRRMLLATGVLAAARLSLPLARAVCLRRWRVLPAVPGAVGVLGAARAAGVLRGLAGRGARGRLPGDDRAGGTR
ncbi:glycosyltransferase [Streptomyces griseosporeus]